MLFRSQSSGVLAISQPTHAWISGQILRAWAESLGETLLLAAEQHDIGWLDWETEPTFNLGTGRPHLFREVGAATHAPMWTKGVQRARDAWGTHVALLVSRHGGVIYRRFIDRHRMSEADATAAQNYLNTQAPIEAKSSGALRSPQSARDRVSANAMRPVSLSSSEASNPSARAHARPGSSFDFVLSPWPFRTNELVVEGEARPLPNMGRLSDELAMRNWLASPNRAAFRARLKPP
jgi:hypothetical protein